MSAGAAATAAQAAGDAAAAAGADQGGAAGDGGAGGGFLGGEPGKAGGQQQAGGDAPSVAGLFGGDVVKDGKFAEGWSETLAKAGFERLANVGKLTDTPEKFLKRLDDAQGVVGKKPRSGLPDASWEEAEVAQWRKDAGIPEDAAGYAFKPEQMPEGVEFADEDLQEFAAAFHEHHASPELAKKCGEILAKQHAKAAAAGDEAFGSRVNALAQESETTFRNEWGDAYETRLKANQDFVKMKFTAEELADPIVRAALSHPKIVAALDAQRLELRGGRGTGLPGAGADAQGHSMSPRQQAQEIMAKNPQWQRDPATAKRVQDLYALEAKQNRG